MFTGGKLKFKGKFGKKFHKKEKLAKMLLQKQEDELLGKNFDRNEKDEMEFVTF